MNSNRFFVLEQDIVRFYTNGKVQKRSKKTKYSTQKTPVAVAGAVIAGAGLGWKIFEFAWSQTEGDIHVKLARMEGAKYPSDDKDKYEQMGTWRSHTVRVYDSVTNRLGDEISTSFDLRFQYNGYGVGYVDIDQTASNDAVGWGLDVEAKIMVQPQNYRLSNGEFMSKVRVSFNYKFSRSIGSEIIKNKHYLLSGNGNVERL